MTNQCDLTELKPIWHRPILLEDMLRPMWKWLQRSGIHHRFLSPMEENRIFYIIRCMMTVLILVLLITNYVFYASQLLKGVKDGKNLGQIFSFLVVIILLTAIFISLHQFYTQHEQLVEFFNDWKQVEMQFLNCSNRTRTENIVKVFYAFFYTMMAVSFFSSLIYNLQSPEESYFFSDLEFAREIFGVGLLVFIKAFSSYAISMFFSFSEIVPALLFYQAGCMIENLELQLNNSIIPQLSTQCRNDNPYRLIWKRYEAIQRLVARANQLFGVIVISNQFCYVCRTCLYLYSMIFPYKECAYCFILVITSISAVLVSLMINWLMSHLYLSCGEFKNSVASLLSKKWNLMSGEHRDLLTSFIVRLDKGNMAASPLNLYTIDPTNLLTLLTIHISYIVFLVQSHD